MDSAAQLKFLISGNNGFGRVNLGREPSAGGAEEGQGAFAGGLYGREDMHAPAARSWCPTSSGQLEG